MPTVTLTENQERLRSELRGALERLGQAVSATGAEPADRDRLAESQRGLGELFLVVVVGEFNAGKSALLNELLGVHLLAEGVTPTTAAVTVIRYGDRPTEEWHGEGLLERRTPSAALRDLAVVDTPGTNAIVRQHEVLTREFLPRADLVLFVTSADRPLTESERQFVAAIREWGKKVVVVVNKVDLLEEKTGVDQVLAFVTDGLRSTLGLTAPIFPTSVRLARAAAEADDPVVRRTLLNASGVDSLRRYVFDTLDEEERLRLKLATPLGVAANVLERAERTVADRLGALADDVELAANVEEQVEVYASDLRRGFAPRLSEIENVIHELNDRGEGFFEETVRLGRVFDLLNPERTRGAFEREVVTDTSERIDRVVGRTVDWFVESESKLWRQVAGMVGQRQQALPGLSDDPDFIAARRDMLVSVADRTRDALRGFDREREAREVGEAMRDAVAHTAIAEIGAVSLGAFIALAFGTVAADVTGLLAATLAAGLGLYILPARKRRAVNDFHKKTEELRERLLKALSFQLEREIAGSTERVREAIAPYTRYVRAEENRLGGLRDELTRLRDTFGRLSSELKPT